MGKILIVEDEENIRQLVRYNLEKEGFQVVEAPDGLQGLKIVKLEKPDLVLLDIKSFEPETYRRVCGVDLQPTLDFARRLESLGRKMWIRFVLVPGLTDAPSNVEGLADFAASLKMVERVEVAPFHKLGEFKWRELRMRYELAGTEPPTTESLLEVRWQFSSRGLTVV